MNPSPFFTVKQVTLKLNLHPITRVELAFLPTMPVAERNRLAGLAQGLRGVSQAEPTGYLLLASHATKCLLLYEAGFRHQPGRSQHYFFGPDGVRRSLHAAVALARQLTAGLAQAA